MTATDIRIDQHAQQYQVATDQVHIVRLELRRLRDLGTLVDVTVVGIGALYTATHWDELGIPITDKRRSRLGKGRKSLVSEGFSGKVTSLAVRMRQNLERYSYPLAGFAPYRWIPVTAYFEWREKHDQLVNDLNALIESYDESTAAAELQNTMQEIADEAYTAIRSRDAAFSEPYADFVSRITATALAKLPTKDGLKRNLRVSYRTAVLEDTADIEKRLAEMDQAELERTQLRCEADKVREMHQIEMERARDQMQVMASPWDEMLKQFEAQFFEKVVAASEMIQKHGYVPGKTAESLKEARHLYDVLCVAKNDRIEQALQQIEQAMLAKPVRIAGQPERSYDVELVKNALGSVAHLLSSAVQPATSINEWTSLEL